MAEKNKPAESTSAPMRINEILELASAENEKRLSQERTTTEIPAQEDGRFDKEQEKKRKKEEKEERFASLKRALDEQISSDAEISSYLAGQKNKMKSAKVAELYALISEGEEKEEKEHPVKRFSTLEEAPKQRTYEQEALFSTCDLDAITPETQAKEQKPQDDAENAKTTVFDADYDALSEKIESGELTILTDENDENQMKLGLADTRQIDMPPIQESITTADAKLRLAFGMMNKNEEENIPQEVREIRENAQEATVRTRKKENRIKRRAARKTMDYEYTSPSQDDEVVSMLEKTIRKSRIKLAFVVLITAAIAFMEIGVRSDGLLPALISPGRYGLLYIVIDIQLLLFTAIVLMDNVINGIKGLIQFTPTPDSVLFAALLFPLIHAVTTALMVPTDKGIALFCLGGAAAGIIAAVSKLTQSKRDLRCFEVISATGEKYSAQALSANAKEANEFYKYLLKDSDLYTVRKAKFIDGFFERIRKRPKSDDLLGFQLPLILLAAVLAAIFAYVKQGDAYGAVSAAAALIAVSLPLSAFLVSVLPVNAANSFAVSRKSALVGNAVADEYDNAGVISFSDSEVFPTKNVKITGFRTYGDYRIDKIIINTAKIFTNLGGPLAEVFMRAIASDGAPPELFKLIDVSEDGFIASMDGHDYYIGKRSFMHKNRFEIRQDKNDDEFEQGCASVMYIALDDNLAAKIYIKYKVNPAFNTLLKDMYAAGLCVGIKTLDPNIDNELLQKSISFRKCPIAILKADTKEEITGTAERVSSGIVSSANMHTFLKMFILADKTRHCVRTNAIVNFVSVFLSFAIVFFLIATGAVSSLSSLLAMMFQLLWIIPISIISFLI